MRWGPTGGSCRWFLPMVLAVGPAGGSCGGSCRWFLRWVLPMVLAVGPADGSCRWFSLNGFFIGILRTYAIFFFTIFLYDNFIRFSIKLYKNPFPKSHKGIMLNTLLYLYLMVLIQWFFYWNIENLRYIFLYDNFIRFSIKLYKNPFPKSHKGIMMNTLLYLYLMVLIQWFFYWNIENLSYNNWRSLREGVVGGTVGSSTTKLILFFFLFFIILFYYYGLQDYYSKTHSHLM